MPKSTAGKNKAPAVSRAGMADLSIHKATDLLLQTLVRMPDPDDVLRKAGVKRKDLRKLLGDDEIAGAFETRSDAALATPWRLEPGETEVAKFFTEQIKAHEKDILGGAWSARPFGFSVVEFVYKSDRSRLELAEASIKPFHWFEPQKERGKLRYYSSNGQGLGEEVDTNLKFMLTRSKATYENTFGEAMLSRLYWPWYFRTNGWKFWMQFLERFGNPLLLGQTADPQALVDELVKMGHENAVAVGNDDKLTAVTSAAAGEFDRAENALCRRVQKYVLGQTLTTDVGDKGSFAAANVHNLVRMDKRASDLLLIMESVQHWINSVCAYNFPGATPPKFVMSDGRGLEIERADRDAKLKEAGIVNFTMDYLLDRYDFNDGDIELPPVIQPPDMTGDEDEDLDEDDEDGNKKDDKKAAAKPGKKAAKLAAKREPGRRFTREQEEIEKLAGGALNLADSPIPADKLRAAILAARDPQDLAERLAQLMDDGDPQFDAILERAIFAADIIGYVHADPAQA